MASCHLVARPQGRRWLSGGLAPHPPPTRRAGAERRARLESDLHSHPSLGPNLRSRASQLSALGKFPCRPAPLPLCPSVSCLETRAGDNACLQPRWPVPGTESAPRRGPQSRQSAGGDSGGEEQRERVSGGCMGAGRALRTRPHGRGDPKAVPAPRVAHSQIIPAASPRDLGPTLQMQKLRPREKSSVQAYSLPPASLPGGDPRAAPAGQGSRLPWRPGRPPPAPQAGSEGDGGACRRRRGTGSWGGGTWKRGQREGEPEAAAPGTASANGSSNSLPSSP